MQSHLSSIGSKLELVNFLLQPLVEVNSGSVATDCCPVTNLVSTNPVERLRGFRVEHFIRPPVQLDFEFQLPLNVACIIIRPDLPPESEMKLELAGSFHTVSTSTTLARICPSVVVGGSNVLMLENKSFKNQDVSIFAKDFVRYQVRGSFIGGGDNCLRGTEVMRQPLKLPNVLQSLRQLRLTVNRVNGPKPVALRSLEVWGTPSNSCSHIQLNLLQTSLTAVQLCSSAPSAGGVNLYSSRKSSPEHGTVAVQRDSITPNDLHRAYVDKALGCSDACYRETAMEVSQVDHCLLLQHKKECQPSTFRAERGPVFGVTGSGQSEMQEVFHIKARTSENKKSLKPQQGLSASHLPGCRHNNNIQDGGKPSCAQFNTLLPQGKNGNLSFSSKSEPTHNSGWSNDDENLPQSSCGLGSDISVHGKQQQRRQTQSAFISERDVPPEFLDKITYDVMQVPMLLPSGHCVDRSTLEKLSNSDALYGRPPTDPFTGTPFSEICKPQFSPELKLQLDKFLSSCSVAPLLPGATTAAKTVGTAEEIAVHLNRVQRRGGNEKRTRDELAEPCSSEELSRKKLRSKDISHAPLKSFQGGSEQARVSTSVWSPSHKKGCHGSNKRDQRSEHRILHHTTSSLTSDLTIQKDRFEDEVAGSLNEALKQLLTNS